MMRGNSTRGVKTRRGFTLIELVVVIMVLAILTAVAAPKLFNTSGNATDASLKQTLAIVRDAIELYAAENAGALPGADGTEATFKTDVDPYIRGAFPKCLVGAENDSITITTGPGAISGSGTPTEGWHYSNQTGEFIINYNAASASDASVNYDEF